MSESTHDAGFSMIKMPEDAVLEIKVSRLTAFASSPPVFL